MVFNSDLQPLFSISTTPIWSTIAAEMCYMARIPINGRKIPLHKGNPPNTHTQVHTSLFSTFLFRLVTPQDSFYRCTARLDTLYPTRFSLPFLSAFRICLVFQCHLKRFSKIFGNPCTGRDSAKKQKKKCTPLYSCHLPFQRSQRSGAPAVTLRTLLTWPCSDFILGQSWPVQGFSKISENPFNTCRILSHNVFPLKKNKNRHFYHHNYFHYYAASHFRKIRVVALSTLL